jgi:hypothetical protein
MSLITLGSDNTPVVTFVDPSIYDANRSTYLPGYMEV